MKGNITMINDKKRVFNQRKLSIKEYRKMKLKILQRDFRVKLTDEEIAHAETLTTETQIDQFCLGILNQRW